jgi:hypothetical protein
MEIASFKMKEFSKSRVGGYLNEELNVGFCAVSNSIAIMMYLKK